MITEEAPASPLALTAREKVPKFLDLLWHCFGGASTSRKFRGLRIRLFRPDRAPLRHIGKKPHCPREHCFPGSCGQNLFNFNPPATTSKFHIRLGFGGPQVFVELPMWTGRSSGRR